MVKTCVVKMMRISLELDFSLLNCLSVVQLSSFYRSLVSRFFSLVECPHTSLRYWPLYIKLWKKMYLVLFYQLTANICGHPMGLQPTD